MLVALVVVSGLFLPFALLTALGYRARGGGVAGAFVAAVFFPLTWTIWYVKDEHPYRAGREA